MSKNTVVKSLKYLATKITTAGDMKEIKAETKTGVLNYIADNLKDMTGASGTAGKDGSKWFVVAEDLTTGGSLPSGAEDAKEGDLILDSTGEIFKVTAESKIETTSVNIKGPKGDAGTPAA